jgi:bifunctional DNA-binding transcriptional regulator/antitoxin component of YhaV-PrlF toxin-antitoxin module
MGKYIAKEIDEIIKITKVYTDGKTQLPKEVMDALGLKRGSKVLWLRKDGVICIKSSKT